LPEALEGAEAQKEELLSFLADPGKLIQEA
jgi:hypothetical protein